MLVQLLLLKRHSPTLFRLRVAFMVVMGLLFLAFAGECLYLMLHSLARLLSHPPVHSAAPSSPQR